MDNEKERIADYVMYGTSFTGGILAGIYAPTLFDTILWCVAIGTAAFLVRCIILEALRP